MLSQCKLSYNAQLSQFFYNTPEILTLPISSSSSKFAAFLGKLLDVGTNSPDTDPDTMKW